MARAKPVSYDVGPLLAHAHAKAAQVFNAALAPLGIEGRHFGVLLALKHRGPLSQRQMTDQLGTEKSSMVRLIDDLEERGLCTRGPDATDRRANAVELTPAGVKLFAAAERIAMKVAAELLSPLTDVEAEQLVGLLRRFLSG